MKILELLYPLKAGDKTVVFSCSGQETIQKQDKDHNQSEMNIHNQHVALQSKMLQEPRRTQDKNNIRMSWSFW